MIKDNNKTLVCIIAETRAHKITWPSFKKSVLDPLKADLLLCVGVPDKYDFTNPFWQFAKYRCATPEFFDWGDAFDEAQKSEIGEIGNTKLPNWRVLLRIKDQWLGGVKGHEQHPGSAGILIYYRWRLLNYMKSEGLLDNYDRFVITRSDFVWKTPHPPISHLNPDNIWIPDGEGWGGLTDRHVVLSKENVVSYLNIIHSIVTEPDSLYLKMRKKNNWNLEQFIDYNIAKKGLKNRVKFFPYVMYSARELNGSTSWSEGQWSEDLGYYVKYISEFQSAVSANLIFKTVDDWINFFSQNSCIGFNSRVMDHQGNIFVLEENKIVNKNIESINNNSLTLSIDYSDQNGFLYLSKHSFGDCEKRLFDEVELIPTNFGMYNLISQKDRSYYVIDGEGRLEKSTTNKQDFVFKNKYA